MASKVTPQIQAQKPDQEAPMDEV
jgi:thiol-disulfide isomerase/thioredoxin